VSDVTFNVPTNLYTSTDKNNAALTNKLVIDTKNHAIKPSIENDGVPMTDVVNGWDLGATGANSFNRVYGRSLEVSNNAGIGKSSDAGYAMDISGATRLSSSLEVGGATTLGTIANVTGTSQFTGSVGIGKVADSSYAIDVSGTTMVSGNTYLTKSLVVGDTAPSTATLHVNASANIATNSVVLEGPNVLFKGQSSENLSHTNFLAIDTKTRSILPYAQDLSGTTLNSMETGWNLGGTGANRFSKIYGRDLEISTNTIKIEDNSGNQISMSFDATTGAVNYTVTTISGEVFVIKGVQTQKISSGAGTIDPSMLEFTGLSFGDTFISDAYDLTSTFTYNLGTTTYTGNGTTFASSSGAQSLDSFVTGTNLTTLLALVPTGTSVVINVGATDGRSAHLEGIDVEGSLVSLVNKIISVKKTGVTIKWTLWNSEEYVNVAGNFLHFIELKNINMASGTYFVAKTAGSLTYNIVDQQYLKTSELTTVNGDLYLYITRGPGKNWTKIPVSLPQSGSIQTQHMANSAITTSKLADNSVTGAKIVDGSIAGAKFTDNSITTTKIADGNVTSEKLADGSISGTKLATGAIGSASMIVDGIITGAKLVTGSIGTSQLDTSSVTTSKLDTGAVTTDKLADSSISTGKISNGAITSAKMAPDSVGGTNIIAGSITGNKIAQFSITGDSLLDGTITAIKLAPGAINSTLLDASSITVDKIASGAISTPKLADLAVTTGKLAATSVTTAKIASGAVTGDKLATGSVASANIVDGAITTAKIVNYAVTSDQISGAAITTGKVADSAITDSKLNAGSVTVDKIASDSVTTVKIADFAVTTFKLADLAVGTSQIAEGAVTGAKLATGAVLAANIGVLEVTTAKIADGAVTTAKIAAGAITSALLDVSAVITSNIATDAVTTAKIAAGAVTTAKIADAAITTAKLNSSSVTTSIIADGSITAAKLAPGFTLPSGGGGGTTLTTASDISVNSIQVNGKAKIERLLMSQKITGTSTNRVGGGYADYQRLTGSKLSLNGNVLIENISDRFGVAGDGIRRYTLNSSGVFEPGTTIPMRAPHFMELSDDGNVVAVAGRSVNGTGNVGFLLRTTGSTTVTRQFVVDHGEGTNNIASRIFGITISGDGTKLFVLYLINPTTNWGIYVYNVAASTSAGISDLSLLAKIPMQSNFPFVTDNYSDNPIILRVSANGQRLVISSKQYNGGRGRVMVFNINYSQTVGVTTFDVTANTNPSYGLADYKPLKLADLPPRFRLKVNSNGYYIGESVFTYGAGGLLNYPPLPVHIFTADKPSDLYSATGVDTYRIRAMNQSYENSTNSATNYYLYSNSTSNKTMNTSYTTTLNFAWQFFKNTTTGEIILWNPSPSGNGMYVTYNTNQTGDNLRLGATGTPIKFTIDPVYDFSSVNTVTTIGTFDGTTTGGVTSGFGISSTISSAGTKIGFSCGNFGSTGANKAIRFYDYGSDNNWTLNQTLLTSSITDTIAPVYGFGGDIRFNSNYSIMVVGSYEIDLYGNTFIGCLSIFKFTNGLWVYSPGTTVYGGASATSVAGGYNFFGRCVSLSNSGYYMSLDYQALDVASSNLYIYKMNISDLTSNVLSAGSVFTNKLILIDSPLDLMAGTDSFTSANYSLKNTGTFLNNGDVVIFNPAIPLIPTLTFKTMNSNGINSGGGGIIEYKNNPLGTAFGVGGVTDYRWRLSNSEMMFETNGPTKLFSIGTGGMVTIAGGITCVGDMYMYPRQNGYSYGQIGAVAVGPGVGIATDWGLLNATRLRMICMRDNPTATYNGYIQSSGEFEIQTGREAYTTLTTSNVVTNRRLHISGAGDIGIGTTAVAGTKLTVAGDLNVSGYVASTKAVPMSFAFNTSFTGPGTASAMCASIQARTFLSKDGNVVVAASPSAKTIYVYRRTSGVWNSTATTITKTDTDFAKYIAVSKDGTVIASSNGTTIWMYRWSGSAWVLQTQTITDATYASTASLGFVKNMRLTSDGSKILVVSINGPGGILKIFDTVTASVLVDMGNTATNGAGIQMAWGWMDLNQGTYYMWQSFGYWHWQNMNIDISDDSNTVIISSSNGPISANLNGGKVLVYDINYETSTATIVGTFNGSYYQSDYYGKRISINQDGTVIAFSAGVIESYNNASPARVYIYTRTVGSSNSWTLSKLYNDIDAGLGLNGFGHELRLNSAGTTICIASIPHVYYGTGTDSLSCGMRINGTWGSLFNLTGTAGSAWGDTIGIDDAGNIAVTEINNTVTPHGGRMNLYSMNVPPNNVQAYGSVVMKTGMGLTARMTINGDGYIGMGTVPVSGTALTISGSVTASGAITGSSDDRLKENEVLVTNATDTILKLRPEIYDKKPEFTSTDTSTWQKESGLIAQDVWYGAPELRHLVRLGTHTDVQVCDYEPIIYPPLVYGVDVSGVEYVTVNLPFNTDASGNKVDASGNLMPIDASGNPIDVSGNLISPNTQVVTVDNRPQSECVLKTVNTPYHPANIVDIPLATDIQKDPDYTALGWGDTPASINYIGLIPYLIKSIQELKAEIEILKNQ
jgi:hypothetical protein